MKKLILCFIAFTALWSVSSQAANCVYGCPTGKSGQVVTRSIYTLSNNATTKFADWAAYQVTSATIDGPSRTRTWKADPSVTAANTLEPADYTNAAAQLGTDRGHQVPLAAFSNTADWATTNYLSNITPQAAELNQGPWERLENAERVIARSGQPVFVVTGPLYEWYFGSLPNADEFHTIPSGYFKVVIAVVSGTVKASAFIMEQDSARADNFCNKEVTIDEVEMRAGINVMPTLSTSIQTQVEQSYGGLKSQLGC
jgi:endonuclease G, mitochondrial